MTANKQGNPYSRFYGALAKMPGATKEEIVGSYSDGKVTSLSELYKKQPREYWRMVYDLENRLQNKISRLEAEKAIKTKRSAVLKRLQQYGVDTTDWNRVNAFLEQPKIAGKRLYDMTIDEMQTLISKLESILRKRTD